MTSAEVVINCPDMYKQKHGPWIVLKKITGARVVRSMNLVLVHGTLRSLCDSTRFCCKWTSGVSLVSTKRSQFSYRVLKGGGVQGEGVT